MASKRVRIILVATLAASSLHAQEVLPPDEAKTRGRMVPDVALVSEDSLTFHFGDLAGKPIILNPVFTTCPYACPAITSSLRDALAGIGEPEVGYHVVTVSFDPADGAAALRAYRDRLSLPDGWILATASPANLTELLDAVDFRYRAVEGGGFAHPNVVAIIAPDLTVSGYVHGIEYQSADIRGALERAVRGASLVEKSRPLLLAVGVAGVLTIVVVLLATRRRPADA